MRKETWTPNRTTFFGKKPKHENSSLFSEMSCLFMK